MGVFYHVSSIKLEKGVNLEPRYGFTTCDYKYFRSDLNKYSQYLKEQIFEDVRRDKFPSLPSRIKSVYLWDEVKKADNYIKRYKNKQQEHFIYEVAVESPEFAMSYDMSWMNFSNLQYYESVKEMANYYYSRKSVEDNSLNFGIYEGPDNKVESIWETLYEGKVIVKGLISSKVL